MTTGRINQVAFRRTSEESSARRGWAFTDRLCHPPGMTRPNPVEADAAAVQYRSSYYPLLGLPSERTNVIPWVN